MATIDQLVNDLDEARNELGLSKAELARAISAEPAVRLLSPGHRNPTIGTLAEVAAALGLKVALVPMTDDERVQVAGGERVGDGAQQGAVGGSRTVMMALSKRKVTRVTSPKLLADLDDTIIVEFSHFVIQETPILRSAQEIGLPASGARTVGGPGGVMLRSRASDHYPSVHIELWNSRPEQNTDQWDATEELMVNLAGGVCLKSIAADMSDKILPLTQAGDYGAIVHVRDDPNIGELEEGSFEETNEHWLVQLWFRRSATEGR